MTIGWYNANEYVSVSVEKHCCYCKRPLWIGITACWIDGVGEDGEYLSLLLRILRCLIMNFMWLYQQDESLRVWDWWMDSLKERIWMWVIWIRSPHLPSSATKIRHEQADLPSKKRRAKKKKEYRTKKNSIHPAKKKKKKKKVAPCPAEQNPLRPETGFGPGRMTTSARGKGENTTKIKTKINPPWLVQ